MTDDNEMYAAAGYREQQNEGHGHRDPVAHPHTALVRDKKLSRYLSVMQMHYDPETAEKPHEMPGQARNLEEFENIVGVEATEAGRKAMETGDMATLKHQTGQQDQQADISGIKAIGKVDDIIDAPAPVVVLLGSMGMGKTDFSGLFGQRKADEADGKVVVGSNIKTLQETTPWVHGEGVEHDGRAVKEGENGKLVPADGEVRDGWVRDFPTFKEWMEQDGDPVHNQQSCKIFIADELSVSAGGQGKQGFHTATKLAKAIYLARKYRVTLIIIAHGPKSVHPLAWRVGTIIKKTSKKQATIADRVQGDQIAGIQGKIDNIPPTDWRFDTADTAPWSWTRNDGDSDDLEPDEVAENIFLWTIRECYERGLSARESVDYVPYSRDWTSRRYRWLENSEFPHEKADSVEDVIA